MLTLGYVGRGTGEVEPFDQVYERGMLVSPKDIQDGAPIDALVIWGGEDISPSLYNDAVADMCYAGPKPSSGDILEVSSCKAAIARGIPLIGICRGAQLVCAVAGGRLIQHVDNHGMSHNIITNDGRTLRTSSVHHQMMYPFDVDHEMIAWTDGKRSKRYIIGNNESDPTMVDKVEPEIVYFPKIKALAIQGHPEFMDDKDPFVQYCMELTRKYLVTEVSHGVE